MGAVSLVHDHVRKQDVALKRVIRGDPDSLLRFKREFRAVRQLIHPHVVRLHDLGEDEHGPYFTMELLHGNDFYNYCRYGVAPTRYDTDADRFVPSDGETAGWMGTTVRADVALSAREPQEADLPESETGCCDFATIRRLSVVLPQLLGALHFLHAHRIVHRDLKPSNVLVSPDGILKVLDFGILAEVSEAPVAGQLVGSLGYAAPEQLRGEAPSPSMDMYALGAMLFEVLSGQLPRSSKSIIELLQELDRPARPLACAAPNVPAPVASLVDSLLRLDPTERFTLDDVAGACDAWFGNRPQLVGRSPSQVPCSLVGRDVELDLLSSKVRDGLEQRGAAMVVLVGPTGSGKTALAEQVLGRVEQDGVVVYRGRGRSMERVAFNLLDAALDSLAWSLNQPGRRDWRGDHAHWIGQAATLFPVLSSADVPVVPVDRRQAFDALLEVLKDWESRGVVLFADDLHWADGDSLALVSHLLDRRERGVIILSTLRDDIARNPSLEPILARADVVVERIGPLDDRSIAEIVRRVGQRREVSESLLEPMVRACDGRPMLAELAGSILRVQGSGTEGRLGLSLDAVIDQLGESSRELLAMLAAGDAWVALDRLEPLTGWNPGDLEDCLEDLELRRLVRRDRELDGDRVVDRVDLYHDSIRAALQGCLSEAERRRAHRAHAGLLMEEGVEASTALVRHLIGAGDGVAASRRAIAAARRAEQQRAFALAADMYAIALQHPAEPRLALLRARAAVLEQSGGYAEAADCWRSVVQESFDSGEKLDARLRQAHAMLAAGSVSDGHATLDTALREMPERPRLGRISELVSALKFLAGPKASRVSGISVSRGSTWREAERDIRIGTMLGYFDPIAGIHFLLRGMQRYRRMGLVREEAWCSYLLAYFALNGDGRPGPGRLGQRYFEHGLRLASRVAVPDPVLPCFPPLLEGCQAFRAGDFRRAGALFDSMIRMLEQEGRAGAFEHVYGWSQRVLLDAAAQDCDALERSLASMRRAMRDSSDSALRATLENFEMWLAALRGDLHGARAKAAALRARFPAVQPTIQRLIADFLGLLPEIHLTDCRLARVAVNEALERGKRFRPMAMWMTSAFAGLAAIVEANALRAGDPAASGRRVEHYASIVDRSTLTFPAMSSRARAYAADAQGNRALALTHLRTAEVVARLFGQRVDEAIASYQRGIREGGEKGQACAAHARKLIADAGSHEDLLSEDVGSR